MLETLAAALLIIVLLGIALYWVSQGKKRLAARLMQAEGRIREQDAIIERARLRDQIERETARMDTNALYEALKEDFRD